MFVESGVCDLLKFHSCFYVSDLLIGTNCSLIAWIDWQVAAIDSLFATIDSLFDVNDQMLALHQLFEGRFQMVARADFFRKKMFDSRMENILCPGETGLGANVCIRANK